MVGKRQETSFLSGARIEVPDSRYKADFDLHDRYQTFSSEVARLALAGIGVVGAFLSFTFRNDTRPSVVDLAQDPSFRALMIVTLVALATALGCALCHRFLAADGMHYHLSAIKLLILWDNPDLNPHQSVDRNQVHQKSTQAERTRNRQFRRSGRLLGAASVCLLIGAGALGASFFWVIR